MSAWQAGDLAVCIDARRAAMLREGARYTVIAIDLGESIDHLGNTSSFGLILAEVEPEAGFAGFSPPRFRKIRPDKHEACEPEFVTLLKRSKRVVAA